MQEAAPLKDYRTSLEVKADDLFDLVKSDSTLLDPYLAASWQRDFTSIHLAACSSASPPTQTTFCQLYLPSPPFGLFKSSDPPFSFLKTPALTGGKRCCGWVFEEK